MAEVSLTGIEEVVSMLDRLGREGDNLSNEAATRAATVLRQGYLVSLISGATGIKRSTLLRFMYAKKASKQHPYSRVNFSGAGIPVSEYKYQMRRISQTRAQILVNWFGGTKVAAGFINPSSSNKHPLSSRNQKTTKNGKTYTYRNGRLEHALGLSAATAYLAAPQDQINQKAQQTLSEEVIALLDEIIGD